MSGTSNPILPQNKTYFREYIGVKQSPVLDGFPDSMIDPRITEFHFILGFATEKYIKEECKKGESSFTCYKGTGEFEPTWNTEFLGPEHLKKLKKKLPNVKVVISIGGRGHEKPFNPAFDEKTWIKNAVDSLKRIFEEYNDPSTGRSLIDGIDINYEIIDMKPCDGEPNTNKKDWFPFYIGELIVALKNDKHFHINMISIAPSQESGQHYHNLYLKYRSRFNIDFVDYQFYNQLKRVSSVDEFVKLYNDIVDEYQFDPVPLVLPGVSTDPAAQGIPIEIFVEGCNVLITQHYPRKKLQGIFVWNANDSVPKQFSLENNLQNLLTGLLAD